MNKLIAILCTAFLALGVLVPQAQAQSQAQSRMKVASAPGTVHIQLKHIMAPVLKKPGAFTTTIRPITPIMTMSKEKTGLRDALYVCQRAPRISEAILNYFMKNPAPVLKNRHLDTDAIEKQRVKIAAYVNRALGKALISEVYVFEGAAAKSGVEARFPGAQQGCSRVLEEYEKQLKAAQDKNK